MREIKFRAWEFEAKEFLYLDPQKEKFDSNWLKNDEQSHCQQYTGLKDKSGKEIYEGDIVRYMSFYPDESWGGEQMVITWNNDISGFNTPFNHNFNCQVDRVSLEVIGNIYENEDLVERV